MKTKIIAILLFLLFFSFPVYANEILNSGFETCTTCTPNDGISDDFDDWTESGVGGVSKIEWRSDASQPEGLYCAMVYSNTFATVSVSQSVSLTSGESYSFTLYTKAGGSFALGHVYVQNPSSDYLQDDGSWAAGSNDLDACYTPDTQTTWVKKTTSFTANATGSYTFTFDCVALSGAIYYDYIVVEELPEDGPGMNLSLTIANTAYIKND